MSYEREGDRASEDAGCDTCAVPTFAKPVSVTRVSIATAGADYKAANGPADNGDGNDGDNGGKAPGKELPSGEFDGLHYEVGADGKSVRRPAVRVDFGAPERARDTETVAPAWGVVVRYGKLRHYEVFRTLLADIKTRDKLVIQTRRGLEVGEVRKPPKPLGDYKPDEVMGDAIRVCTTADNERWDRLSSQSFSEHIGFGRGRVTVRGLKMKLSDVEAIFGEDKLVFYFTAEERVDFRDLVKDLARRFRTRIEMRQIGARDEAKVIGDVGPCGQPLCCGRHLWEFAPVSMKMAKNQRTTLDPSKISGACGRLKCCLRYEDEQYTEMKRDVPKTGCNGTCKTGKNIKPESRVRVLDQSVLSATVLVADDDNVREWIPVDDLEWDPRDNLQDAGEGNTRRTQRRRKTSVRRRAIEDDPPPAG